MTEATTTAQGSSPTAARRLAGRLGLTARPETFGEQFRNSAAVWLSLMLYAAIAEAIVVSSPSTGRPWPGLGAPLHLGFALAGLAAIWCTHRVGFPAAWDARLPMRPLLPLLLGAGFGLADGAGRPITPQTPLLLGSLTKSFTAVAVMQPVEQGRVELDAPVRRYIPWFHVADPEASAQITVRHLLSHTSGISGGGEADWLRRGMAPPTRSRAWCAPWPTRS